MKNVKRLMSEPFFRVPIPGIHLSGWALKYVSGMEEVAEIKPGYWLSRWTESEKEVTFNFEAGLHMCFTEEAAARHAAENLKANTGIETETVKI